MNSALGLEDYLTQTLENQLRGMESVGKILPQEANLVRSNWPSYKQGILQNITSKYGYHDVDSRNCDDEVAGFIIKIVNNGRQPTVNVQQMGGNMMPMGYGYGGHQQHMGMPQITNVQSNGGNLQPPTTLPGMDAYGNEPASPEPPHVSNQQLSPLTRENDQIQLDQDIKPIIELNMHDLRVDEINGSMRRAFNLPGVYISHGCRRCRINQDIMFEYYVINQQIPSSSIGEVAIDLGIQYATENAMIGVNYPKYEVLDVPTSTVLSFRKQCNDLDIDNYDFIHQVIKLLKQQSHQFVTIISPLIVDRINILMERYINDSKHGKKGIPEIEEIDDIFEILNLSGEQFDHITDHDHYYTTIQNLVKNVLGVYLLNSTILDPEKDTTLIQTCPEYKLRTERYTEKTDVLSLTDDQRKQFYEELGDKTVIMTPSKLLVTNICPMSLQQRIVSKAAGELHFLQPSNEFDAATWCALTNTIDEEVFHMPYADVIVYSRKQQTFFTVEAGKSLDGKLVLIAK